MDVKDVLNRIGFVRNSANLSARELSLRMGMSPQYVAQIEQGRIALKVSKLFDILEICDFPIERFFSPDIENWEVNTELTDLIQSLPLDKKKNIINLIKN